jgi:anti-sigma B factor antagonist
MTHGSASESLGVFQRLEGLAVVLRTTGEIDMNTAPVLAAEFDQAMAAATAPAPVVADLSDVTFLSSAGLAVLLDARERCSAAGTPLRIVATNRPVLRALAIAGLAELLSVHSTVEEAVAPAS